MKVMVFLLINMVISLHAANAANVYKHVAPDGRVIYSDTPLKDAQPHVLPEISTIPLKTVDSITPDDSSNVEQKNNKTSMPTIHITHPQDGETILAKENGNIEIKTSLTQTLMPDFKILLERNGQLVMQGRGTRFILNNQNRGEHTFTVKLVNANDEVLSADSVTLYVKRSVVLR